MGSPEQIAKVGDFLEKPFPPRCTRANGRRDSEPGQWDAREPERISGDAVPESFFGATDG